MRSTRERARRAEAVVRMAVEQGATPAGEIPVEHAQRVVEARSNAEIRAVEQAHRDGRAPPEQVPTGGQP